MGRQGPIHETHGGEEPSLSVALHDERSVAGDRVDTLGVGPRTVVGTLGRYEVRLISTGPLLLLLIPPYELLAFAPGLSFGVCRSTVVEDAAVVRPRPGPLRSHQRLLPSRLASASLVDPVGIDARVDPTPASRRAIVLELQETAHRRAVGYVVAAYLFEDALYVWLFVLALGRVVPGQGFDQRVARILGVLVELLEPTSQMEDEPGVAPCVVGRLDGLLVPLQHAVGLGKGAVLLGDERRRYKEDLRAGLAGVHPVGLPGGCGLYFEGVQDDEPVEGAEAVSGHPALRAPRREVLPKGEATLHVAVLHLHDRRVVGVVAGEPREVVEELAVLDVEVLTVPSLHCAGDVLGEVAIPARIGGLLLYVVLPRVVILVNVRHYQVTGEDVVQGSDVRRALDGRVAA